MISNVEITAPEEIIPQATILAGVLNTDVNPSPLGSEWLCFHHAEADGLVFTAGQYSEEGETETLLHINMQDSVVEFFGVAMDGGRGAYIGQISLPNMDAEEAADA